MKILIACEFSGRVRDAFFRRGHDAISCDFMPSEMPGPHIQGSVIPLLSEVWDLVIAFPPCTHLCSSGARSFAEKRADGRQQQGIDFFMLFTRLTCSWAIENPVGIMSSQFREPDQIIQPWQFGHPETKATCLWLSGLPRLVPTQIVEPEFIISGGKRYSRIHYLSGRLPPSERSRIRSLTYQGIADAMAKQWG